MISDADVEIQQFTVSWQSEHHLTLMSSYHPAISPAQI